jgi:signal transduction histidine kinase
MASWLRENQAPVAGRNAPDELRALWPHQPAAVAPLLAADQLVGVLACGEPPGDRLRDDDFELLGAVARESALVLRNLRLEAQLRERLHEIEAQAAELRHSRGRIVRAQDEERRRIERDLHDGVQQQLVALGARLRRASGSEVRGSQRLLRELAAEAEEAIFALQELGRGIFPSVLADQGLGAALRTQAARIPLAIHVEVEPTLAARRFDRELEAALYFVGLEAMTNAQKHAPAATVTVSLREGERERRLVLAVHDDGPGFNPDAWAAGSGLQNMRDRIGAAGGELRLESRPGAGTWVEASVPLAAEVVELHRDADSRR